MKKFLLLAALSLVLSCQQAKTAVDVADNVCKVITMVDPASSSGALTTVLNIADTACEFVRVVYDEQDGTKVVQLVPKALVVREARAYRAVQQPSP